MYNFYEFFAGGGMARAGLGGHWACAFANDFNVAKAATYRQNWGDEIKCADVATIKPEALPGRADLIWASFPCQDLSLAGNAAGLGGQDELRRTRSGSFWPFWEIVKELISASRGPDLVVLENVVGLLHANKGADFAALARVITDAGFNLGALTLDARDFLPQSRPRVFLIAVAAEVPIPLELLEASPNTQSGALNTAIRCLPPDVQRRWLSWRIPHPPPMRTCLADLLDEDPEGVSWDTIEETAALLAAMSPANLAKVAAAKRSSKAEVGAVFKRTRPTPGGGRSVFAEVRFDGIAGCIRPPGGGSSRQRILIVNGSELRSRLLSPRELARLMGLADSYILPARRNEAFQLLGDGVVVPAVRHLAEHLLEPMLHAKNLARLQDVWSQAVG